MRILSLLPSATEIVCALGARHDLVGRSEECDYPAEVAALPAVMRARDLDAQEPSTMIDARVQAARGRRESLYALDLDALRALRPDVILTQDLCGVCSVTDAEVRAACEVAGVAPRIVSLTPRTLDEVWASVDTVGRAIGRADGAARLSAALRHRTERPSKHAGRDPLVAVLEWLDPPILAGLWTPQMIARAGARYLGPAPGAIGHRLRWEELGERLPQLAIVSPCSFPVARTRQELERMRHRPEVAQFLDAVPVVLADEAYFSRPGPRLADGVELVARLLGGSVPAGPMPAEAWGRAPRQVGA